MWRWLPWWSRLFHHFPQHTIPMCRVFRSPESALLLASCYFHCWDSLSSGESHATDKGHHLLCKGLISIFIQEELWTSFVFPQQVGENLFTSLSSQLDCEFLKKKNLIISVSILPSTAWHLLIPFHSQRTNIVPVLPWFEMHTMSPYHEIFLTTPKCQKNTWNSTPSFGSAVLVSLKYHFKGLYASVS